MRGWEVQGEVNADREQTPLIGARQICAHMCIHVHVH